MIYDLITFFIPYTELYLIQRKEYKNSNMGHDYGKTFKWNDTYDDLYTSFKLLFKYSVDEHHSKEFLEWLNDTNKPFPTTLYWSLNPNSDLYTNIYRIIERLKKLDH